jgi:hypothetical protein
LYRWLDRTPECRFVVQNVLTAAGVCCPCYQRSCRNVIRLPEFQASARITALDVLDVRFPTSDHLDGSDAMNPGPDHSAAYVVLRTDAGDGHEGRALAFTTGRGDDAQAAAIAALAPPVVGLSIEQVCGDLGAFSRSLVHDPQLRRLGPERDAIHMATGAVVNVAWDLAAKSAWRYLGDTITRTPRRLWSPALGRSPSSVRCTGPLCPSPRRTRTPVLSRSPSACGLRNRSGET